MTDSDQKVRRGPLGLLRAFTREILVPIALAILVIQFVIQAFTIPTGSMKDSLLVGDFLLGLKFIYGSPLPFTERKLPGLTDPDPGDVLIFRYPGDPAYPEGNRERYRFLANLFLFGNLYWDREPPAGGKRLVWYSPKDFIKRCVAESGQRVTVAGAGLAVDGREMRLPPRGKYLPAETRGYEVNRDSLDFRLPIPGEVLDLDTFSLSKAAWIRSLAQQEHPGRKVELILDFMKDSVVDNDYVLPYLHGDPKEPMHQGMYALLRIRYGLAYDEGVPFYRAEGVPFSAIREAARTGFISITDLMHPPGYPDTSTFTRKLSWWLSRRVEHNEFFMGYYLDLIARNVAAQGQQANSRYRIRARIAIDGLASNKYAVRKDCYFMMGDNRDQSLDSRYWGLVSINSVKAKAFIIYYSFENEDKSFRLSNPLHWFTIPGRIQWTRIGRLIE